MRLINTSSLEMEEFIGANVPPYAILSHTWEGEEVSLQEFTSQKGLAYSKRGYEKIAQTCNLARMSYISYAWVDTCCIDKSSSAELSEAINSMFQWYRRATVCYAYLQDLLPPPQGSPRDVDATREDLRHCRWFTRGWTLQELIAPKSVLFFDQAWNFRGAKEKLTEAIQEITGIDSLVLQDSFVTAFRPISTRLSWASSRRTTRVEDTAYCLLGIFDVSMPLLYGEEEKAFIRLQHEIIKSNSDLTIFGWHSDRIDLQQCILDNDEDNHKENYLEDGYSGILASSPTQFRDIRALARTSSTEYSVTNRGIRINCSLVQLCLTGCVFSECDCIPASRKYVLEISKHVYLEDDEWGIVLKKMKPDYFVRSSKRLLRIDEVKKFRTMTECRPIYLATVFPVAELRPQFVGRSTFKITVGKGLSLHKAAPENLWDSCNRHFMFEDDPTEQRWVLLSLTVTMAVKLIPVSVLFNCFLRSALILEDDMFKVPISLVRQACASEWTWEDVTNFVGREFNTDPALELSVLGYCLRFKRDIDCVRVNAKHILHNEDTSEMQLSVEDIGR